MTGERLLRPGSGRTWERVFRGVGPGEDAGRHWTPCPIAALTFATVEPAGQLLVGTLRLGDLVFRREDHWTDDRQHPGDSPPPQDGTDIQFYLDRAKQRISWHRGENRRVNDGEPFTPGEVENIFVGRFMTYSLVSEEARQSLKLVRTFPYSDALVAAVLRL